MRRSRVSVPRRDRRWYVIARRRGRRWRHASGRGSARQGCARRRSRRCGQRGLRRLCRSAAVARVLEIPQQRIQVCDRRRHLWFFVLSAQKNWLARAAVARMSDRLRE